jgi:CheY-like chemotaxis protein
VASTLAARSVATSRSLPADTILLVEDDHDIAGMYSLKLQHDGYRVHVVMTGETALALAIRSRADLVLLDVGLPTMDGLQVLAALPVVILSSCDDPDLIERGLQLGAIDYLIKSRITPTRVSGRIAGWMAAQALRRPHRRGVRASAVSAPERAMPSGVRTPPSPERGERFDVCRGFPIPVGDCGRGRRVA